MPKMILAGIVSSLSPQDLDNIRSVFSAVVRGDGYKVGELFLDRSKHFCTDRESFIKGGFYFFICPSNSLDEPLISSFWLG